MFIPEKMIQVHVVFLEKDVTEVAETVVRHGALQVVDSADMEDWAKSLSPGAMEEDIPELKKRQELITSLIKSMNLSEHFEDIEPVEEVGAASERKIVEIQKKVNYTLEQLAKKEEKAKQIRELKSHLEGLAHLDFSLKQRDTYAYLAVEIGLISVQYLEPLQSHLEPLLHVLSVLNESGGNATILVVALKRDQDKLQTVLTDSGFQRLPEHEEEAVFNKGKFEELDQKEERILEELEKMRE